MAAWLVLLATAAVPASLLCDFSWESTIGVELFWAPPHSATYLAVTLAGVAAIGLTERSTGARAGGVRLGRLNAPLGAWLVLWAALAFGTAVLFDRWWQQGYGLTAGIWHPPQILKAVAFFALTTGAWLVWVERQERRFGALGFALAGGVVLELITVVSLPSTFANRQHSAFFHQLACATHPVVLVALAVAGRSRYSASLGALAALLLQLALVWLLPLVPGEPQVGPIYNTRDHMLPPPFPLLLVAPALALDALLRIFPGRSKSAQNGARAVEAGLAFFAIFSATQWFFAEFLLSPAAVGWLFAGGGVNWPFFLRVDPAARTAFWQTPDEAFTLASSAYAALLAVLAAAAGLALGTAMKRLRR